MVFIRHKSKSASGAGAWIQAALLHAPPLPDTMFLKSSLSITRDIFMLTYYLGGINLKDLLEYNFKDKDYIRYVRHKTRNRKKEINEIAFSLQPEAKEILNRYLTKKVN